jgi:WD40 repeat protein
MNEKKKPIQPTFILRGHTSDVTCLQFYKTILLSGDSGGEMRIWNLKNKRTEMKFNDHTHLLSMGKLKDSTFFTHGREGKVILWDSNKMEIIQELRITENETQYSFCKCSSDKNTILCTPSSQDSSQV